MLDSLELYLFKQGELLYWLENCLEEFFFEWNIGIVEMMDKCYLEYLRFIDEI